MSQCAQTCRCSRFTVLRKAPAAFLAAGVWLCAIVVAPPPHALAQAPQTIAPPPPVPRPAARQTAVRTFAETYRRPDLQAPIFAAAEISLTKDQIDETVRHLAAFARNFPDDKRAGLDWRAKALAVALRLRPDDRDCIVANGQLARGVLPAPLESDPPLKLTDVSLHLLKTSLKLYESAGAADKALGWCLLDIASHIDEGNRKVLNALHGDDKPAVDWDAVLRPKQPKFDPASEESADLLLNKSAATVLTISGGRTVVAHVAATAEKLPDPRKKLQFYYPESAKKVIDPCLEPLRDRLKERHAEWPVGWQIDLSLPGELQADCLSVPLAAGLALDSLISGEPCDPAALIACGLDCPTGRIVKTFSLGTILAQAQAMDQTQPPSVIIIASENVAEFGDELLLHPENLPVLGRLCLLEARTFAECVTLARKNRAPALQKTLANFSATSAALRAGGASALRSPAMLKDLQEMLDLIPNLVSARILLAHVRRQLPSTFSKAGSLRMLRETGRAIIDAVGDKHPAKLGKWPKPLETNPYAKARLIIDRMRNQIHPEARPLADALSDLGRLCDSMVTNPPGPQGRALLLAQIKEARQRMYRAFRQLEPQAPPPPPDPPDPP